MTQPTKTKTERYNPGDIEQKWQARWEADGLYKTDLEHPGDKCYFLTMLPYTSGDLHVGHWYPMSPSDAAARYKRMNGKNVFFPMGFDAFGLPAENAAIQRGIHPRKWTYDNIDRMRGQLKRMGAMFDWDHEAISADPEYYKWNQWFFLKMYERGLAYRKNAPTNWCPKDQTVLANEQVVNGVCERCGTAVIQKDLEQWFFRIRDYADELLDFSHMEWPDAIVTHAAELDRPLRGHGGGFRARHPRSRDEGDPRLHDATGHDLRRDFHGPRAGAPARLPGHDA